MAVFSLNFIAFVGIAVLLYYLVPRKYQWMLLLIFSILFYYISGGLKAGIFIVITIANTFYGALTIERITEKTRQTIKNSEHPLTRDEKKAIRAKARDKRHKIFLLSLLINLGMLIVLKYANFFTVNVDGLLSRLHVPVQIPVVITKNMTQTGTFFSSRCLHHGSRRSSRDLSAVTIHSRRISMQSALSTKGISGPASTACCGAILRKWS